MPKTVAIVGHAPSTRMLAPYDQGDVEIWTMNDSHGWGIPRVNRWFEIHHPDVYTNPGRRASGYMDTLARFRGPVYMQYPDERIPNAKPLPLKAMEERYGTVFGSSFAWMFCLAVEESFERIELYGCDLADNTEYASQRESAGYWIGLARGRGIDVYLPPGCPILTRPSYGLVRQIGPLTNDMVSNRLAEISKAMMDTNERAMLLRGMREEAAWWRSVIEGVGG